MSQLDVIKERINLFKILDWYCYRCLVSRFCVVVQQCGYFARMEVDCVSSVDCVMYWRYSDAK
jgi:hypothetical protein